MEFKKIPPSPSINVSGMAPEEANPAVQLRAALRLMAKRYLHGARGLLLIVGSFMLVISLGLLLTSPGFMGNPPAEEPVRDLGSSGVLAMLASPGAMLDVGIGVGILVCGLLVMSLPRVATLLPVAVLVLRGILVVAGSVKGVGAMSMGAGVWYVFLGAVLIRAVKDAFVFRRESQAVRERFRAAQVVQNLERHRERQAASGPPPRGES